MTPQEFIAKWRSVVLKESTASQSYFIDLCHLMGLPDPITEDPIADYFTFEEDASENTGARAGPMPDARTLCLGIQGQDQGPRQGLRQT